MNKLFNGLCYLGRRDGIVIPVLREADAVALEPDRAVVIHAFATASEATAFAGGVRLAAGNRWSVGQGVGTLERLVAVERHDGCDPGPTVVDHGGAQMCHHTQEWSWLERRARIYGRIGPRHPPLMFIPGEPPKLRIDNYIYALHADGETLCLTYNIKLDEAALVRCVNDHTTPRLTITADQGFIRASIARAAFDLNDLPSVVAILKDLAALGSAINSAAYDLERGERHARLRQDRRYCRVVEKMQRGWTLTNDHGRGKLSPPAGHAGKVQILGYTMLNDLVSADLVRLPEGADPHGRNWHAVYRLGDLTGADVRPTKRSEGRNDRPA